MCRPLSQPDSPPGGGGAVSGPGGGAPAPCGNRLLTELVTLRLFAGWPETSPARLVAAASIKINDATANVFHTLPVPPNVSRHQPSNPIASSFNPETFARLPQTDASCSPERVPAQAVPTARKDLP